MHRSTLAVVRSFLLRLIHSNAWCNAHGRNTLDFIKLGQAEFWFQNKGQYFSWQGSTFHSEFFAIFRSKIRVKLLGNDQFFREKFLPFADPK